MEDFENRLRLHAEKVRAGMKPLDIDPAAGERKEENMPKKRIGLVIAAVIVAVAGFTAMAATFDWDTKLLEYLNLTPEQAEKLSNSTDYPGLSVSDAGVTVTVRQTLADSHGLYVLYDATAPEGFEFSDDIEFVGSLLEVPDTTLGTAGSCSWNNQMLSHSGNSSTWLLTYDNTAGITGGELRLTLDVLGCKKPRKPVEVPDEEYESKDGTVKYAVVYNDEPADNDRVLTEREKALQEKLDNDEPLTQAERLLKSKLDDYVCLFDGHWELAWDFEYNNCAIVLEPDLAVHDEKGREYTVKKLELSPMSICLEVEQNFEHELERVPVPSGNTDENGKVVTVEMGPQPPMPVINMKDGTKAALDGEYPNVSYGGYFDGRVGGINYLNIGFEDGIIDLENVESVTYGDQTIKIK